MKKFENIHLKLRVSHLLFDYKKTKYRSCKFSCDTDLWFDTRYQLMFPIYKFFKKTIRCGFSNNLLMNCGVLIMRKKIYKSITNLYCCLLTASL